MKGGELEKALDKNENLIVSKEGCPFCLDAVEILNEWKIKFDEVRNIENEELSKEIERRYGISTFPKIFLKRRFVGGASDLRKYVTKKEFVDAFGSERK
ncbi:glutaredoxin [Encephalitozoon intestinalis ATCC 50506]|uniref:Glutaredoxin n=1 Tax=Encephalitozoon intestinalis (strain ATCC 50506) TaxID=876142 RepID=E0S8Z5_ENCIT|nr:glutaredoxin [Encephalitozoon intestinalis ATCC 50506]ADM12261.1 glutaredoxin [Encephalitozoon intestinalis ATCC 50506]UTX46068.1 glutaredoxin [Encephalitozoon intestinalis]